MAGDCILCGKCLEVCPLLNATGREELGPRAKADLCAVLAADRKALSEADAAKLAGLCLGCHRCKAVCSQGVDVPGLVSMLRAAHPDFRAWLWKQWLTHAKELWAVSSSAAKLIPKKFQPEKFGPMLKMLAGLKGGPGLEPFLSVKSFPDTYRGEKMLLFAGCTANYVQTRWLMTALRLLDGLGVEVLPGDFQCCGGGLKGAGCLDEARAMAEHNVAVWRAAGKPKAVVFCASCRSALEGYEGVFESSDEAQEWQNNIFTLSVIAENVDFMISANRPKTLGYHRPCHVDAADSDYRLLQSALRERLVAETKRECCGFGGVMGLGAPELTDQVNRRCWDRLGRAEVVLTGCSACAARLSATAPQGVSVGHWLEIIR